MLQNNLIVQENLLLTMHITRHFDFQLKFPISLDFSRNWCPDCCVDVLGYLWCIHCFGLVFNFWWFWITLVCLKVSFSRKSCIIVIVIIIVLKKYYTFSDVIVVLLFNSVLGIICVTNYVFVNNFYCCITWIYLSSQFVFFLSKYPKWIK